MAASPVGNRHGECGSRTSRDLERLLFWGLSGTLICSGGGGASLLDLGRVLILLHELEAEHNKRVDDWRAMLR